MVRLHESSPLYECHMFNRQRQQWVALENAEHNCGMKRKVVISGRDRAVCIRSYARGRINPAPGLRRIKNVAADLSVGTAVRRRVKAIAPSFFHVQFDTVAVYPVRVLVPGQSR